MGGRLRFAGRGAAGFVGAEAEQEQLDSLADGGDARHRQPHEADLDFVEPLQAALVRRAALNEVANLGDERGAEFRLGEPRSAGGHEFLLARRSFSAS